MSDAERPVPKGAHGPHHRGCPTCDPHGGVARPAHQTRSIVRVHARGEEFKIVQLAGNLFVCAKANGNCCCGWAEKGRMPFDNTLWSDEWERRRIRNRVHLTFSGCLGPCAVGNNALLELYGQSIWFKDLNDPSLAPAVFDYIEAMLAANAVLAPPEALEDHVYQRYLRAPDGGLELVFGAPEAAADSFDGLDPVCLMSVDPATARHRVEHAGQTYVFCAPSCKKLFVGDPDAYISGAASTPMD